MSGAAQGSLLGEPNAAQVYPLVDVAALDRPFDYAVPAQLEEAVRPGVLVACPLAGRVVLGVVADRRPAEHSGPLSAIVAIVDANHIPPPLWDLAGWVGRYYLAPTAPCLRLVLPPGAEGALRRRPDGSWRLAAAPRGRPPRFVAALRPDAPAPKGPRRQAVVAWLTENGGRVAAADLCRGARTTMDTLRRMDGAGELALLREAVGPSALLAAGGPPPPHEPAPELTEPQTAAVAAATAAIDAGTALLLRGVTGSGKTEVYLHAIEHVRRRGGGTIVLVPEIALTPQLLQRLRARLGESVAIWHSAMTAGERAEEYARVRSGEADVVLGARSAIFAPVRDLRLIVVDEEHDSSYKQDQTPRYDARQVAARRAREAGAAVIYGSATPRPESWKALPRHVLDRRVDGSDPPRVTVVDMRTQPPGPVSRPLARALHAAAGRGEKAIVLASRRGHALMALCRDCGWIARCHDCDVALVLHRDPQRLVCHHCGHEAPVPRICPSCRSVDIARQGAGTEGVEEALRRLVPAARLVRMDGSSAAGRGSVARLLHEFAAPGPAILLGTQMVAKGHDLPAVTVAAVIDADAPLQHADFRAEERAFDLIVQAAGRAGRRGEEATVIVQAYEPEARAVRLGARHAVEEFLEGELARRTSHGFPPHGHLVRLVLDGPTAEAVTVEAALLASAIREQIAGVTLLGPAPLHRLRGRHRRALLARAPRAGDITAPLRPLLAAGDEGRRRRGVRVGVDVDPQDT